MSIIYTRLGEVALRHEFYKDGIAKDLLIRPTSETERILRNGKMLFRKTPGGFVILYRAEEDETTPISPLNPPFSMNFYFRSENPTSLLQITDFDEGSNKYEGRKIPYFQNDPASASTDGGNPEILSYRLLDGVKSKTFSLDLKIESNPSSLRIKIRNARNEVISPGKDTNGNLLPDLLEIFPDENGLFRTNLDLKGKPEGTYQFTFRNEGDTMDLWSKTFWICDNPNQADLGLIQLNYAVSPNHLYGSKEFFQVDFQSKESLWTFYVVNGNEKVDLVSSSLEIEDDGNEGPVPYGTYTFDQVGDSPNPDVKVNNKDTVIFRSQSTIPYFETPKLNLRLIKKPGNQVLISNLPNPSRATPQKDFGGEINTEIYVYI